MRRSRQGGDEGETSPLHLNFYDAQGRKDSLWVVGDARMSLRDPSGQSHEILDSVLYLRGGMIDSVGYGNGVGQKYGYDSTRPLLRSMVSSKSGNTLHRLEMTYDDEGNVQTQTRPNGEKALFEYDGLYRLKLVRYPTDQSRAGSLQYSYDLNGNRLGFVHEFGDATWNYYQGTNLLNSGTSSSEGFRKYGWDRRGNLSTETRWGADPGAGTDNFIERRQMSWNVRNELERAVVVRRGAEGYDSTVVGMLYGEDGNRVLKAVVDSVSGTDTTWRVTNRWVYDGTAVVADSGASGPGWTWHAYNGLSRVAELSGSDTARVRFLLTDHLGTVQAILDDTGAVVGRYQLDPYGNLEGYQGSASTALLYTGKGFDADVGAWYFNARFYDAERGMFIGRDPGGQYFSPYVYTGNTPVIGVDPDGELGLTIGPSTKAAFGMSAEGGLGLAIDFNALARNLGHLAFNEPMEPYKLEYRSYGAAVGVQAGGHASFGASVTLLGGFDAISGMSGAVNLGVGFGDYKSGALQWSFDAADPHGLPTDVGLGFSYGGGYGIDLLSVSTIKTELRVNGEWTTTPPAPVPVGSYKPYQSMLDAVVPPALQMPQTDNAR